MGKQFTLGKNERLKSRKQIEHLFNKGKSFAANPFRIYYSLSKTLNTQSSIPMAIGINIQFGVGVSSKNFRKAVDRNRIKRLTREAWRLQNLELKQRLKIAKTQLVVFFIYTGKELPDFAILKGKVAVALKKLAEKIDESDTQGS